MRFRIEVERWTRDTIVHLANPRGLRVSARVGTVSNVQLVSASRILEASFVRFLLSSQSRRA